MKHRNFPMVTQLYGDEDLNKGSSDSKGQVLHTKLPNFTYVYICAIKYTNVKVKNV